MQDIFDFNSNELTVEYFCDSPIYTFDNFYKYPNSVIDFINSHDPVLWKNWEKQSYNGIFFNDYRHNIKDDRFRGVTDFLSSVCTQQVSDPANIVTNKITFKDFEFNDYFNNYWGPHRDIGYNGIIYLNTQDTFTNLYSSIAEDEWNVPEHAAPWRPKTKYKIEKQLTGKFNRLILFDGAKFLHGMSIDTDEFFKNSYRFNQVIFFKPQ